MVVSPDFRNAFNGQFRASVVQALLDCPELSHLAFLAKVLLESAHGLEHQGELWGECEEGLAQGDPLSMFFFCIGIQEDLEELDRKLYSATPFI